MCVHVSICSKGNRFLWCVTDEDDCEPLACGVEISYDDAVEQTVAHPAILRKGVRVEEVGEWLAKKIHRDLWEKEFFKPTGEVLYCDSREDRVSKWNTYPIVKKTRKNVYVKCGEKLFILKRDDLELTGEAWSHKARDYFHTEPYHVRCADEIAERNRTQAEREEERLAELATFSEAELNYARELLKRHDRDESLLLEMARIHRATSPHRAKQTRSHPSSS